MKVSVIFSGDTKERYAKFLLCVVYLCLLKTGKLILSFLLTVTRLSLFDFI